MEQLVIFILFIVVSIISSVIQQRNKAKEEEAMRREFPPVSPPAGPEPRAERPVITRWRGNLGELQDQVKRMLQENAPPVIRPVIIPEKPPQTPARPAAFPQRTDSAPEPLEDASEFQLHSPGFISPHDRVSNMQARVAARLRAASDQTTSHRPVVVRSHRHVPSTFVRRLRSNPAAVRDAFVASLIFSPPKSLDTTDLL